MTAHAIICVEDCNLRKNQALLGLVGPLANGLNGGDLSTYKSWDDPPSTGLSQEPRING